MNSTNPLKGKRVAIVGGDGARPESHKKLVDELELAELEWVYSDENKTLNYDKFIAGLRPGKYDYIFFLVKFTSHIAANKLKNADLFGIPLIRVRGSYNAQNFINDLFAQTSLEPEKPVEPAPVKVVIKKVLEPAKSDDSQVNSSHSEPAPSIEKRWAKTFGSPLPEVARARIDKQIQALETRIKQLSTNQQDPHILEAAHNYYSAMSTFLDSMPVPAEVVEASNILVEVMNKHGISGTKPHVKADEVFVLLKSNVLLSEMLTQCKSIFRKITEVTGYDRFGACTFCKSHKSRGCTPMCGRRLLEKQIEYVEGAQNIAKKQGFEESLTNLIKR